MPTRWRHVVERKALRPARTDYKTSLQAWAIVCSPIPSTTDSHGYMDSYLTGSVPLEKIVGFATTPTSEKGSCANVNREVHSLPWFGALSSYPAPPYSPILPYGESGIPFPGNPVVGLPHVNFMPPKSVSSCISNGDSSDEDTTHSSTRIDAASDFPVAVLPGTPHIAGPPHPVESQSREKKEPQNWSHQYQKSRKKARIPRFSCDVCGAQYVQRQGLNRHRQEKHEYSLCFYCDAKCGRPYEYRDHLEKYHPDVDCDMVLGKARGSRRRTAYIARHGSSQKVSLSTIEHGRWGPSGIRRHPPAKVKSSTATLPPPDITYVPEPESTRSIMTSNSIPEVGVYTNDFDSSTRSPQDEYTQLLMDMAARIFTVAPGAAVPGNNGPVGDI